MRFDFSCPWCGSDTTVRGTDQAAWRFRIPCDLCNREMVVTWDHGLEVARVTPDSPLSRSEDETVRFRVAKRR